jgi:RimJ/RimL family protein N-acetyltransferase
MAGMVDMRIEPWAEADLQLLYRTNSPAMTEQLGGPETEEKLLDRHRRYLAMGLPDGQMFSVVALPEEVPAGTVGFWEREWDGQQVYEMGWATLPEFQGRGIGTASAVAALAAARAAGRHRFVHAYPKVTHPASNAICAGAGFTLIGPCDFEYPPGHPIRCNDWRFDLKP